jgi:L-rhamnose mutarotase
MVHRFAFVFGLRSGKVEEYRRRHDEIWPEMLDLLHEVGIFDYSIRAYGDLLFGSLKCYRQWNEVEQDLKKSPVQERWSAAMADLIDWQMDGHGRLIEISEVFHFEGDGVKT